MGLISCRMIQTVIALTNVRADYASAHAQLSVANNIVTENLEPTLAHLFQRDSEEFDRVIKARRARDQHPKGSPERKRLSEAALEELRIATETPREIAEHAISLAKTGFQLFDLGFQSARGDSAVAISAALGAASGAVSIILLNLTHFRGSDWARQMRQKADGMSAEIQSLQIELFSRMNRLRTEVLAHEGLVPAQEPLTGDLSGLHGSKGTHKQ